LGGHPGGTGTHVIRRDDRDLLGGHVVEAGDHGLGGRARDVDLLATPLLSERRTVLDFSGEPSVTAAVHPMVNVPSPRLTMAMLVGAWGLTSGLTTFEGSEAGPVPMAFTAATVKV